MKTKRLSNDVDELGSSVEPELPSAIKYFFKYNSFQASWVFDAMDLHRTLEFNSNPVDSAHRKIISNQKWIVQ